MIIKASVLLRYLIPFYDPDIKNWSGEARLMRWLTFAWLLIGLIVLYSASFPEGEANYGDGFYIIKRQVLFVWLGMIFFNWIVRSPVDQYSQNFPLDVVYLSGIDFCDVGGIWYQR